MRLTRGLAWLAVALMTASTPLPAQEQEEQTGVEGEVIFGVQHYVAESQNNSAKFGEYQDVPNGFLAERLLLSWTQPKRYRLDVDAIDIGQGDQRLGVTFGKIDLWRVNIHWR